MAVQLLATVSQQQYLDPMVNLAQVNLNLFQIGQLKIELSFLVECIITHD